MSEIIILIIGVCLYVHIKRENYQPMTDQEIHEKATREIQGWIAQQLEDNQ